MDLIPDEWKIAVCKVLKSGTVDIHIIWTTTCAQRWETESFGEWRYECHNSILQVLTSDKVYGALKTMKDKGVTYAFFFSHKDRKFYGKICLKPCLTKIKILSAHIPNKGDTL